MTQQSNQLQKKDSYKETAKRLDCTFRIGKYGFKLFGQRLLGGRYFIQMTPLDGWIFNKDEIVQAFLDDPDFEVDLRGKKK